MKRVLLAMALLAAALTTGTPAWGQVQFVSIEPECRIYFSFTAVGVGTTFDNRTRGCNFWAVSYSSYVFAGPLSLTLESAPNATPSVPGVWVAFAGTVVAGINPNTSLVGAETQATGYYPWIRMNLTATGAGAGLVVGTAYGWRTGPPNSVSILGTPSFNISQYGGVAVGAGNGFYVRPGTGAIFPVSGAVAAGADGGDNAALSSFNTSVGPFRTAPSVFNGTTWDRMRGSTAGLLLAGLGSGATGGVITGSTVCNQQAAVTLTGAGLTEIIPLVAARTVRICHFSASWQSAVDINFSRGTGANCAVGTAAVSGVYEDVLTLALDFPNGPLIGAAGEAICVNQGAAIVGGGVVTYAIY